MRTVGVRFRKASRIYTFDAGTLECGLGDWVVVETERGMALGTVASVPREMPVAPAQPFKRVLRLAEERDILRYEQNCEMEGYAFQFCAELIRSKDLPMKLVDVEYLFDGSKALFYFSSEGRVDFRDLVRDLARQFHTRIEMRQIGVRDEAKMVGGVGCCGRELCCATFLTDFAPISVRMAKDQNVSLNPVKISGICGRLMCCLGYEHRMYEEMARDMPKVGKRVQTVRGEGKVTRRNVLDSTFSVYIEGREYEFTLEQWKSGAPAPAAPERSAEAPARPGPREHRIQRPQRPRPERRPREEPAPREEPSAPEPPRPREEATAGEGAAASVAEGAAPGGAQAARKRRRRRRGGGTGSGGSAGGASGAGPERRSDG